MLPSAGPDRTDINRQGDRAGQAPFVLVDLANAMVSSEPTPPHEGFADRFQGSGKPAQLLIGIGDGVSVDIWEAGSDTLFSARPAPAGMATTGTSSARNASLQEQIVGADGTINLPFVGRINVAGLGAVEVEQLITKALANKAARAQVVVRVFNHSGMVTVAGDVAAGSRVSLSVSGERLLDVLAAAGGVRAPAHETRIQLTRGRESLTLPLLRVLQDPRENIYLRPGDLVTATRHAQSFTAFGATGRNAQVEFGAENISLIEAVAKTGGLLDSRADPRGVYVFRTEPRAAVDALRASARTPEKCEPMPCAARTATHESAAPVGDSVRVVYRLDLGQVGSYFVAQRFAMQDRDIVYVSSATTNELKKFFELLGLVTQPVIQGVVIRGALQ